jgi:hypothetical protein
LGSKHNKTHANGIRSNIVSVDNTQGELSERGEFRRIDRPRLIEDQTNIHLHVATLLGAVEGQVVVKGRITKRTHVRKSKDSSVSVGAIKHVLHLARKIVASHPDKAKSSVNWRRLGPLGASGTIDGVRSDLCVALGVPKLGHGDVVGLQVTIGTAEQVSQTRSIENNFDHRVSSKVILNFLILTSIVVPYLSLEDSTNNGWINLDEVGREFLLGLTISQTKTR